MKKIIYLFLIIPFWTTSQTDEKKEYETVKVADENKNDNDPKEGVLFWNVLDSPPLFPGCEIVEEGKMFDCYHIKMMEHIKRNLRYPEEAINKNIQGRVIVSYIIDVDGKIVNVSAKGADLNLQNEAIRIISILPKMKPGIQNGIPVRVKHVTPITFRLH